jgi:hypothetical protein
VAALLDPLEGGVLIAVLALPTFAAGRGRWGRERWLLLAGLASVALAVVIMTLTAPDTTQQALSFLPWMSGVLAIVSAEVWLLRRMVAEQHPKAANALAAGLALLMVVLVMRVAVILWVTQPWRELSP